MNLRYFKTHATVNQLPGYLKLNNIEQNDCSIILEERRPQYKVIYVARNPKDTIVSLYHHAKSKPEFEFQGNFQQFFQLFLLGKVENSDWFTHVLDWYQQCQVG